MKINGEHVRMVDLDYVGNIRALRKSKKLSQEDVARFCGVSVQAYQRWERNITKMIPEERFNRLKDVLNNGLSE